MNEQNYFPLCFPIAHYIKPMAHYIKPTHPPSSKFNFGEGILYIQPNERTNERTNERAYCPLCLPISHYIMPIARYSMPIAHYIKPIAHYIY
jgi:hypothetical protein